MLAGDAAPGPFERSADEQILDALGEIARVEHALCVQRLTIYCALGLGLAAADGTPSTHPEAVAAVNAAAESVLGMAVADMRHLRRVNEALRLGGRPPEVGRAVSVAAVGAGTDIDLGALDTGQLREFLDHEDRCAAAVDALYAQLQLAVAAPDSALEGGLLDQVMFVLGTCGDHVSPLAAVRATLDGVPPADYLRATRREPADDLERSLLRLSDRYYALVVDTIRTSFAHDDQLGGQLLNRAVTVMEAMNEVNGLLVERRLLPAFTPA